VLANKKVTLPSALYRSMDLQLWAFLTSTLNGVSDQLRMLNASLFEGRHMIELVLEVYWTS